MLTLDSKLKLDADAIASPNLCNRFSDEDLQKIGNHVWEGYDRDKRSRTKWENRTQAAMDLAMQIQKDKNFPWPGASNIAFPLVTIGALQFHSRAYPAIIGGVDVVKCRVNGEDSSGAKTRRAERISSHMSWQVLEEQPEWEEEKDRLLITLPIVGTVFTKSYQSAELGRKVDETVLAQDLVLDYYAKSVESCPRKTHLIPFFRNQIHSNIERGTFRNIRQESWYAQPAAGRPTDDPSKAKKDNRQGLTPPPTTDETTPYLGLEQHVDLDLDGDGYAEPYIITVEEQSRAVLRIVTGFDREEDIERTREGKIISIRRMEYFTRYLFIPSPDGGVYGVGFGVLLGPLNESVNTIINQLTDAGTMQTTKGGFLGRGAKIRGGVYTFAPLEWKRVDSSGDDLRKNIVPLEVGEPSTVLFQLLGLLINYVNRISGTTDPMVGENPGQNTTAETMRTMVEQGSKIYSAVFKRIWRCMKQEFKKDYILNGLYMPVRQAFGKEQMARREDYLGNPDEIAPAADPNITSEQMAISVAMTLKQFAATTPGYNIEAVEKRVLKAMKVDGIEEIFPGVAKTGAPKDVKLQIQEMKTQVAMAELQAEEQRFLIQMQEEVRVNTAEILKIAAEVENMKETTEGDKGDRQVAMMQSIMKMLDSRNQQVLSQMDIVKKRLEIRREEVKVNAGNGAGVEGRSGNRGSSSSGKAAQAAAA